MILNDLRINASHDYYHFDLHVSLMPSATLLAPFVKAFPSPQALRKASLVDSLLQMMIPSNAWLLSPFGGYSRGLSSYRVYPSCGL